VSDVRLPDAPWRQSEGLRAIVAALSDGESRPRYVGGAVRDSLLGLPVSDIDLATPLLPEDVTKRLENAGIKAVPTGIDHGTITAVSNSQVVEVTTLRRDVSTDGRRATVAFSNDWQEDAARRDFTINALFADSETGEVFDYFGGLDDLKNGKVRFIGDAATRIAEDHLRILRFFRFHARFGKGEPDAVAISACAAAANSLMALSRERIADELMKLLALPNPSNSAALMFEKGIFQPFLPEAVTIGTANLDRLLAREAASGTEPLAARRLNALLPKDMATVDQVAARLKLSNKLRVELAARLSDTEPQSINARALGYRLGVGIATDLLLLYGTDADWEEGVAKLQGWTPPVLPIKGGELVTRGLSAGPVVAKTLQAIEQQWIEEDFPDATRVSEIADQCVVAMLSDRKS
jgi:poly(A) polymerase